MIATLNFLLCIASTIVTFACGGLLNSAIERHFPGTTIGALAGCGVFALVCAIITAICAFNAD